MMKLGTQTGNVFNHLDSRAVRGEPALYVGMGATMLQWTDRHAATIIAIKVIRKVTYAIVTRDTATRTDKNGMSESQEYTYSSNPNGTEYIFKKHPKTGFWKEVRMNGKTGRYVQMSTGTGLKIGVRDEYYDYSF